MSPSNIVFFTTRAYRKSVDFVNELLIRFIPQRLSDYVWACTLPRISKDSNLIRKISLTRFQIYTRQIPGMIRPSECELLLFISTFCGVRGDIIEVGSWLGLSTINLAKGCLATQNGKVYAVDTFVGNPKKTHLYRAPLREGETIHGRFLKNIRAARLEGYVVPCKMTSREARKKLANVKARIIFIDACHEYEAVKNDILLWKDLLLEGGFLVLHDFVRGAEGCARAIHEEVISSKKFKCILLSDSLLVARKTESH